MGLLVFNQFLRHNSLHMNEEKIRHSLAHMLAMQVLAFDPGAKLAIGPVIDNGFYYDFEFSEGKTSTEKNLKKFQKGIKKLTNKKLESV